MEFKSIRPSVLEYHTNEFAVKHAKMDLEAIYPQGFDGLRRNLVSVITSMT